MASEVRNCLIAMDGSEHSDYALDWYCKNVHKESDHVILVYCPEMNDMHSARYNTMFVFDHAVMKGMLKEERDRIRADLERFGQRLKDNGVGGKVQCVIAAKPGEGIIKSVKEYNAHVIVLGSRGQGAVRRTLMGSVSDYVVHHAHIPVIVCKHPNKHVQPEDLENN